MTDMKFYNSEKFAYPCEDPLAIHAITEFIEKLQEEKLPFVTLDFIPQLLAELENLTEYFARFDHLLLLGIGGSALGPHALQQAFSPQDKYVLTPDAQMKKHLWVIDNVNAGHLADCLKNLPLEKTLVLTVSKSGSTLETISQYFICKQYFQKMLPAKWQNNFFIITDEEKGFLRRETTDNNYKSLPVPALLGGRFSIFCAVGLVPALFLGIDYKRFIHGAMAAQNQFFAECASYQENCQNPLPRLFELANFAYSTMANGYSELIFFNYIPKWSSLNNWFRQLWSESLGKNGQGSTPVTALGTVDQHSILQLFLDSKPNKAVLFLTASAMEKNALCTISKNLPEEWKWLAEKNISEILDAEANGTKQSMINHHIPLCSMVFPKTDEQAFGKIMWELCMTTILTAHFLGINPYDQPAVEESKKIAKATLSQNSN